MVSPTVIVGSLIVAAIVIACIAAALWLDARRVRRWRVRGYPGVPVRRGDADAVRRDWQRVGDAWRDVPPVRARRHGRAERKPQ